MTITRKLDKRITTNVKTPGGNWTFTPDGEETLLDSDISSGSMMEDADDDIIGHMTEVERILNDKLNHTRQMLYQLISSHRTDTAYIISRLDGIQNEIEKCIMQRLDVNGKRK